MTRARTDGETADGPMIEFDGIEVRYGDTVAVPAFDLSVDRGEFFTLLGPSGCGKTTVLRTLAGLIQPSKGTIRVAGKDVTRLRGDQRELGMVFQNYALFPSMSVRENIIFGLKVAKTSKSEIDRRLRDVTNKVELAESMLGRTVAELSGGQQQRVAIARSLILEPKILLLDEPLSNLDAKLRAQLRVQLKELQERVGITTMYVTHDQEEALALSDRIAVMKSGQIEQLGAPRTVYTRPSTEFVCQFIGEATELNSAMRQHLGVDADSAYVRTENIELADGPTTSDVAGDVTRATFRGDASEYEVDCGTHGIVQALVPERAGSAFAVGDRVAVRIDQADILAYSRDGSQ